MPSGARWTTKTDDGWVLTEEGDKKRYYLSIDTQSFKKGKKICPGKLDALRFERARWKILTHLSWLTIRWKEATHRLSKVGKAYSSCRYSCAPACYNRWSLDNKDTELLSTYVDHVILSVSEEPVNLEIGARLSLLNSRLRFYYDWLNAIETALEELVRSKLPAPHLNGKFKQAKLRINNRDYFFEVSGFWPYWKKSFWPTDAMVVLDWNSEKSCLLK